jgi:hypothetical protein
MGLAGKVKLPAAENEAIREGEQGTCGLRVAHSCRLVHRAGTSGQGCSRGNLPARLKPVRLTFGSNRGIIAGKRFRRR